jgi:hypothetical protein
MEEIQKFRVMNPEQKLFVVLSKEKEVKTPKILAEHIRKWHDSKPPTRKTIFNLGRNLHEHKDLRDQRTVCSGM